MKCCLEARAFAVPTVGLAAVGIKISLHGKYVSLSVSGLFSSSPLKSTSETAWEKQYLSLFKHCSFGSYFVSFLGDG